MPPRPVAPRVSIPAWLPDAVREHGLSPATAMVLLSICLLADDELICEQSERNLAQHMGIARSAVQKALTQLVEIHAIVDLGRRSVRTPQRFRVSAFPPPTAAQLRMLATTATRRATHDNGAWIVAVE